MNVLRDACILVVLACAAVPPTTAQTTYRWTGNVDSAWGNADNWRPTGVPGLNDTAQITASRPIANQPDIGTNAFAVRQLLFSQEPAGGWRIGGSGGSLTVGTNGISHTSNSAAITNGVNFFIKGNQAWYVNYSTLSFYVPIQGTGVVTTTTGANNGTTYYLPPDDATFRGKLIIQGQTLSWQRFVTNPVTSAFGLNAAGTAPGTISLQGGVFRFLRCSTLASGPTPLCDLRNDFESTASGGNVSTMTYVTGGGAVFPQIRFSGHLYLDGPFVWREDGDAWPYTYVNQGPVIRAFAGGIIVTQGVPVRASIRYTRNGTPHALVLEGTISDGVGAARNPLILALDNSGVTTVIGTNTYQNGTYIDTCGAGAGAAGTLLTVLKNAGATFGGGDVTLAPGAKLALVGASGVSADKQVRFKSRGVALPVLAIRYAGTLPAFGNAAPAVLAIDTTSGTDLTGALGNAGMGPGAMSVGMSIAGGTFNGSSLKVGAGNVYRLGGGGYLNWNASNGGGLVLSAPGKVGVLTGNADVQVGSAAMNGFGSVVTSDTNDFTGTLTITGGIASPETSIFAGTAVTTAGRSPFGSSNGDVYLRGGELRLISTAGATVTRKRKVYFASDSAVQIDGTGSQTKLELDSLNRQDNGILMLRGWASSFQNNERFAVTNQVIATGGSPAICAPYLLTQRGNGGANLHFATYDATTGFGTNALYTAGIPSPGTGLEVCNSGTTNLTVNDARSIYALRLNCANLYGSGTVGIAGGGLLVPATATNITVNLDFGGSEAVCFVNGASLYVAGKVSGSGGLTKGGNGNYALALLNTNNDFTGTVTVNRGDLSAVCDKSNNVHGALGPVSNNIVLNGGYLGWRREPTTSSLLYNMLSTNRTITLGPLGGGFKWQVGPVAGMNLTLRSKITGTGPLYPTAAGSWGATTIIDNPRNDYSGGTIVGYNNYGVSVTETGKLGTGPVVVQPVVGDSRLDLMGTNNLKSTLGTYLPLHVALGGAVFMYGTVPVMGALTGAGDLTLGDNGSNGSAPAPQNSTVLTVGLDNTDFEFYGRIREASATRNGALIKGGTGTFSLFGAQTFTGGTTVTNGTLNLMGSVLGNLGVGPSGRLSGSGVVGGNLAVNGGTLAALLSADVQPLIVAGNVALGAGSRVAVATAPGFVPGSREFVLLQAGGAVVGVENLTVTGGYQVRLSGKTLLLYRGKAMVWELK